MGSLLDCPGLATPHLRMRLPPRPDAVRDCLIRLRASLHLMGLDEALSNRTEIALAEALNNIVEHAFPAAATGQWISLILQVCDTDLCLELRDNGQPMPQGDPARPPPRLPEGLAEGGYGWPLICKLCSHVGYDRQGGENVLTLAIPRTGAGPMAC